MTTLPSSGIISLSDIRTHFVGPSGTISLGTYYKATNGVPAAGILSISVFRGKGRLGIGQTTFVSDYDIISNSMIFRLTGNGSTSAAINIRATAPTNTAIFYHCNLRHTVQRIVQNSFTTFWAGEEFISYATLGVSLGNPYTLYLVFSNSSILVQRADRTVAYTFTNRFPGTQQFSVDHNYSTCERVLT